MSNPFKSLLCKGIILKYTHTQCLSVSSVCVGGLKTEVHNKERGMQYLLFSITLMCFKIFFLVKASVYLTLFFNHFIHVGFVTADECLRFHVTQHVT
jgi:hypothetical protein